MANASPNAMAVIKLALLAAKSGIADEPEPEPEAEPNWLPVLEELKKMNIKLGSIAGAPRPAAAP